MKYKNIKYISIENHGVSYARNLGIAEASGEYLYFMDSDDILIKDCFENFINYNPDSTILYSFRWSDFYKNTMAFLTNPRLENALKKHGYVLDFKPHPNFRMYDELFNLNGETVRLAPKTVDEFSYGVFITDFSSFVFDFVFILPFHINK